VRSALRYAEIFFRRASNVGFADAEIVEDRFRGIPFLTIAPPSTLKLSSRLRWMLPTPDAIDCLIEHGREAALRAIATASWVRDGARGPAVSAPILQEVSGARPDARG
jgi:NTE family protein